MLLLKKGKQLAVIILMVSIMISAGEVDANSKRNVQTRNQSIRELLKEVMPKESGDYLILAKDKKSLNQLSKKKSVQRLSYDNMYCKVGFMKKPTKRERKMLQESEDVVMIEPDNYVKGSSSSSVASFTQEESDLEWNINMIRSSKAVRGDGKKVKVAIIDSGIDYTEDINVVERINLVPGEETCSPLFEDFLGHGTSVAGIIGAKDNEDGITGINPNVEIYSAKVLDNNNCAPLSRVIDAIYWAIDKKVDVINMSFGTETNSVIFHNAIKEANKKGIIIVAAAGNGKTIEYPAAFEEVISVGSVDSTGNVVSEMDNIDIFAPGELIKSTGAFGGTIVSSGTSMAAPHITGVISLLLQKGDKVSLRFIRKLLCETANVKNSSEVKIVDAQYAYESYDRFMALYQKDEDTKDVVPDNTSELIEDSSTGYVEGRWSLETHDLIATHQTFVKGTKEDVQLVKIGQSLPDIFLKAKDNENNSAFHGFGNYIAYTSYLYKMSLAGFNAGYCTPWTSTAPEKKKCDYMRKTVINLLNSQKLVSFLKDRKNEHYNGVYNYNLTYYYDLTQYDKQLLLLGMSVHCATDAIAHNSCYRSGSNWVRFNSKNADNDKLCPKRFLAASKIAQKITVNYGKELVDYRVFALLPTYYDGSFAMIKLVPYAKRCNAGEELEGKYYDRMKNISITSYIQEAN